MGSVRSGLRRMSCLALLLVLPLPGPAQWASNRGYQLLQRVDDVLFGVDNLSLVIIDRRHVGGTLVRVNVQRPNPVRGSTEFVVDLPEAVAFRALPENSKNKVALNQLEFASANLLDGTLLAAEFACESTRQPGRASRLAKDLFERGGPEDVQTVYCELQPDGKEEARPGVEIRFSESANAVSVNRQWLSTGSVTPAEVIFGTNSKWRIDRRALNVRRTAQTARCCSQEPATGERPLQRCAEPRSSQKGGNIRSERVRFPLFQP